ncbi:CRISPR-associated protein Csy3 [invertebrate metagenome]|uniref:CRISPR-associated protein Csy3 n=1 Tax=invertebrate metagenome TaxID=1711999 RepID=A0A2H9T5Y1_9ZZZZ
MAKLTTASVLAFERNLDVSDGVFSQYDSKNDSKNSSAKAGIIAVRTKSVRGTISNRLKNAVADNPAKLDAEIQKANLQTVDVAMLDHTNNMLKVHFTCKVLPFDGAPCVCNNQDYQERIKSVVHEYLSEQGVDELARRYAANIINGRWLWRNRMGSETVEITVRCTINGQTKSVTVADARTLSLQHFEDNSDELQTVAGWVAAGLRGDEFIMMQVEARAKVGYGQEVYPSQELVLDTGKAKSKVLYMVDECTGQAGMHSQKINNAIRTIDTWYGADIHGPIAIEPYGAVTTLGTAFRQPKQDFYSLLDNWVLKNQKPAIEQQHYVMAVLIRGGVFGASGKE